MTFGEKPIFRNFKFAFMQDFLRQFMAKAYPFALASAASVEVYPPDILLFEYSHNGANVAPILYYQIRHNSIPDWFEFDAVCYNHSVPKEKSKDLVSVNLRYPREVREKMKAIAEKERRSLNEQIVYALERWLEQQKPR